MKAFIALLLALSFSAAQAEFRPWSARELRVLQSFNLKNLGLPPKRPSNAYADNSSAAQLGQQLFFDTRLSATGELSCASCHQPEKYFTDGKPQGVGVGTTERNTMTMVGSAHQRWFYWDGRRDSLWSQALVPFEAPAEMGSSRTAIIKIIMLDPSLKRQYQQLFGPFPAQLKAQALPAHAGVYTDSQGQENWSRLSPKQQHDINTVYANLGKAIAAFERTLSYSSSRFDRYLEKLAQGKSDSDLLTKEEKSGARLFMDAAKTQCLQCHNGPLFSNGDFHNIGTGNFNGPHLDFGRVFGLQSLLMDEFNCLGPFSDAEPEQCTELRFLKQGTHVPLEGSFKTPSLRNVAATSPYFHDGSKATLREVLAHYNEPPDTRASGHELRRLHLSAAEIQQIESFLRSLSE